MDRQKLAYLIWHYVFDEGHAIGRESRQFVLLGDRVVPTEALGLADPILAAEKQVGHWQADGLPSD